MNALISQQGPHDDFARGHAVAPAKVQEIDRLHGLRMELAMLRAMGPRRENQGWMTARGVTAAAQRKRALNDVMDALDAGPKSVREVEDATGRSEYCIREYLKALEADGHIVCSKEKNKNNRMVSVWHVVAAQ